MSNNELTLEIVISRRKELVRNRLWDSLTTDNLKAWSAQFKNEEDRTIAKIAMDALIVRTKESAKASMWHFICSALPEIIQDDSIWSENGVVAYDLLREPKFNLRILRLERSHSEYTSGQSSDDLIRLLREEFCVHESYFGEPDNESHVVLLDEISASGNQALRAIDDRKTHLGSNYQSLSLYLLAIHKKGYDLIRSQHPEVKLFCAEILGDETSLAKLLIENNLAKTIDEAHVLLTDFTNRNFIEEGWDILGYKEMAICYKPPFTACNNMAGLYLSKTLDTDVRLFERGLS